MAISHRIKAGKRGAFVLKKGKLVPRETPASERLPPELAELPSEIVTKDPSDASKAHELDAPHVIETIADDYKFAEAKAAKDAPPEALKEAAEAIKLPPIGERLPLTQERIDKWRFRSAVQILNGWEEALSMGGDVDLDKLWHVWFPTNNVNNVQLRDGKPPANILRPGYLKNFKLVVDPFCFPRSICDKFDAMGRPLPEPTPGNLDSILSVTL